MKLIFAALLVIACVPLVMAQGTYTQIDVPDSTYTEGNGIDTAGDVVGTYGNIGGNQNGFILSGASYTTVVYAGSMGTALTAINDIGQAVGIGYNPDIGFLYSIQTQTFTEINDPHANNTSPFAINNAGTIVGAINYSDGENSGFVLVGSAYRQILPTRQSESAAVGITASNQIVGEASNKVGLVNFLYSRGTYSSLTIPNAPEAVVTGINSTGTALVGYYTPSTGTVGFLYQDKTLTTLQFPGSLGTVAGGINSAGVVVGTFEDAEGNTHGFTWTPPASDEKK